MKLEAMNKEREERELHQPWQHRMKWFVDKWADGYQQVEFSADLQLVLQAVHQDAMRETHHLQPIITRNSVSWTAVI